MAARLKKRPVSTWVRLDGITLGKFGDSCRARAGEVQTRMPVIKVADNRRMIVHRVMLSLHGLSMAT